MEFPWGGLEERQNQQSLKVKRATWHREYFRKRSFLEETYSYSGYRNSATQNKIVRAVTGDKIKFMDAGIGTVEEQSVESICSSRTKI